MTNLTESPVWESGIFRLETTTPTLGGPVSFSGGVPITGHDNAQAQQLANRTTYLKQQVETNYPLTTQGDILVAGNTGQPTRLAKGTNGQVLSSNGTTLTWTTPTVYMSNPMTTSGDIIYGGVSGVPTRLAASTNGYVLTQVGGIPSWAILPVRQQSIIVAASDELTALTTGTAKVTFRMPYAFTLSSIRASLTTAQTSGSLLTVNVKKNGTTVFSTKITFDNTEKTTVTAAAPSVLSTTALADDDEITVDIDQVGDGTAKGLKIMLIGVQP